MIRARVHCCVEVYAGLHHGLAARVAVAVAAAAAAVVGVAQRMSLAFFQVRSTVCFFGCSTKKLKKKARRHLAVSSTGRSVLDLARCANRSRVFRYSPHDWLPPGDSPACYQGRRDDNTYSRLDFQLISASTIACTEAADRTRGPGFVLKKTIESWFTAVHT